MKIKFVVAAVVVIGGIAVAVTLNPCACVVPADIGEDALRSELSRALSAEQAFRLRHGRFAGTVAELEYVPDSTVSLALVPTSDSSITISATWGPLPEVTCALEVRGTTRDAAAAHCTRERRRHQRPRAAIRSVSPPIAGVGPGNYQTVESGLRCGKSPSFLEHGRRPGVAKMLADGGVYT